MGFLKEEEEMCSPVYSFLQEIRLEEEEEEEEESGPRLEGVEEILNYKFADKNLLREAFLHPSFYYPVKPSVSYERLEYMGDSVINMLVSRELYFLYPDFSPGQLTRLRAANVGNEKLARVAVKHGLHHYLLHKSPFIEEQIREFKEAILDYPLHSNGLIETPKFLADMVESSIGAVFIDSNFSLDTTWKVFKRLLEPIIGPETMGVHPVTELLELCQKNGLKIKIVKDSWKENTTVDVLLDDKLVGTATYGMKKEIAQNRAAKAALEYLKGTLGIH